MKNLHIKGGIICLLCFFNCSIEGYSQSFFHAEITPQSAKYGEVKTTQLTPQIIERIENLSLNKKQWASLFHLKTQPTNPPVIGDYDIIEGQIVFIPRFLPDPSLAYIVSFSFETLNKLLGKEVGNGTFKETVTFTAPSSTNPNILSLSPEQDELPQNILRIYIHFSSPMSFQNPYDFISIIDQEGKEVFEPFVIVPQGLWNIDRTRLTLLFHPGRIKRGVGPNMTEGDILHVGDTYQLKISNKWKGSNGKRLKEAFTKTFTVGDAINEKIDYKNWKLATDKGRLTIKTKHPLDQALAKRMLLIRAKDGTLLNSYVEFNNSYKITVCWKKHQGKELELVIDPRLEDVCGNTPLNAFDYESGNKALPNTLISRTFTVE